MAILGTDWCPGDPRVMARARLISLCRSRTVPINKEAEQKRLRKCLISPCDVTQCLRKSLELESPETISVYIRLEMTRRNLFGK